MVIAMSLFSKICLRLSVVLGVIAWALPIYAILAWCNNPELQFGVVFSVIIAIVLGLIGGIFCRWGNAAVPKESASGFRVAKLLNYFWVAFAVFLLVISVVDLFI